MKIIKKISYVIVVLLILFAVLAFIFRDEIRRVYRVVNLFNNEEMAHNFMEMDAIFPVHTINKSEKPTTFNYDLQDIVTHFDYEGKTYATKEYLKESRTSGFLVIHRDTVIFEEYFNGFTPDKTHISWSMCKSIISALIGIAVEENHIQSLEDPIDKYLPKLKKSAYGGVSIKDVLHMSSGVHFDEDYQSFNSDINRLGRYFALGRSFDKYVMTLQNARTPGTYHNYVSMDTQVLGMVIRAATGKTISAYCEEKIWKPMGAEADAQWIVDKKGMEGAFGGLNATLRDYARFGQIYLHHGKYNQHQIVDSTWVANSFKTNEPQLVPGDNPLSSSVFGYGYQWWVPSKSKPDVMAIGVYSQYIYLDPTKDLLIVKLSGNPNFKVDKMKTHWEHIALFRSIGDSLK